MPTRSLPPNNVALDLRYQLIHPWDTSVTGNMLLNLDSGRF